MTDCYHKALPIYLKMAEDLLRRINSGVFTGMLPAESELSKEYKVGRNTTRNCLEKLEAEGVVYRVNGKGTFISTTGHKKNKNILLVVDRLSGNAYESLHSLIAGAVAGCHDVNTQVQLVLISQLEKNIELVKYDERFCSGILFLFSHILDDSTIAIAKKSGMVFGVAGISRFEKCNFLDIDNRQAMRSVVDRLFELGHRRFGVVFTDNDPVGHVQKRLDAVIERLAEHNLSLAPEMLVMNKPKMDKNNDSFASEFFKKDIQPPTAIICVSDQYARLVMQYLHRHNYLVPQDISVTGFDDHEMCQFLDPPLSSVHVDYFEIGNMATKIIIEQLNNFSLQQNHQLYECKFVERASIGIAPKKLIARRAVN